jgi:predicted AAA+ superfamily ATPase
MINLPRNATQHLQSLFAAFPVVVVTGARQVGKTTLLRQVFPDLDYVVFDASLDLEQARSEPDLFLRNHPAPVILDEIQYAPELVASIKRAVDAQHAKPGQFLLTGSQQWQVMQALAESLAGRVAFVELSGLSLSELTHTQAQTASTLWLHHWMQAQEQGAQQAFADQARAASRHADGFYSGNLQEWLWRGFMPKAQTLDLALVPDFWQGYHRTYVERDARLAGEVGDWHDFGRFVRLMSALTAQEINHSQLGREIGITPKTAQRWLRMMQATFQWFELPPFFANRIKRVSKSPKGYLVDTGMACHHAAMSSPQALGSHPLFGALFETAMVCEIRKTLALMGTSANLYHWRASTGAEVDCIIERDGWLHPIEIKLTAQPTRKQTLGLQGFRKAHPDQRIGHGLMLCAVEQPRWISEDVLALPWNLL